MAIVPAQQLREVQVLVENLTTEEFDLVGIFAQDGTGSVPDNINRAARLTWRCEADVVAAAQYVTIGPLGPRRLTIGVSMPKSRLESSTHVREGTTPRFIARLEAVARKGRGKDSVPTGHARPRCASDAQFRAMVRCAPHVSEDASPEQGAGCEWLVLQCEPDLLKMRVRLFAEAAETAWFAAPSATEKAAAVAAEAAAAAAASPRRRAADSARIVAEISRLRAYCEEVKVRNQVAEQHECLASIVEVDFRRFGTLPEKVHVDLALAILGLLLRRRMETLRFLQTPEVTDGIVGVSAALTAHADRFYRALVLRLGYGEERVRESMAHLLVQYLADAELPPPDVEEICTKLKAALGMSREVASPSVVLEHGWSQATSASKPSMQVCETSADTCVEARTAVVDVPAFVTAAQTESIPRSIGDEDTSLVGLPVVGAQTAVVERFNGVLQIPSVDIVPISNIRLENIDTHDNIPARTTDVRCDLESEPCKETNVLSISSSGDEGQDGRNVTNPSRLLTDSVPEGWTIMRELVALSLAIGEGTFDARTRAILLELAERLGVSAQLMARWEADMGEQFFDALKATKILKKQQEDEKGARRSQVAIAAAGGGLVLALTGGIAAPAVAGGMSALGIAAANAGAAVGLSSVGAAVGTTIAGGGTFLASLGTSGAAVMFGAGGAGLTGWKMSTRWGALKELHFAPLSTDTMQVQMGVEVSNPDAVELLDAALQMGHGELIEDIVVPCRTRGNLVIPRGARAMGRTPCSDRVAVRYRFSRKRTAVESAVHVAIFVSGWLREDADLTRPWQDSARIFYKSSGHMTLRWETELLRKLSTVFADMVRKSLASSAASHFLRGAAVAGTAAAATVSWPVWIISSMAQLDNIWLVCADRAQLAGKCLAHVLADKRAVGQRPVTLVGHSMGARLIFYCLQELHSMGELYAVDDVILMAAPVATKTKEWQQVRSVVAGRMINCYLPSDWTLAFLYRYLEWGVGVAGLSPVQLSSVENIDVTDIGVGGHDDYPNYALEIMAKARASERTTCSQHTSS